jgi:Fe-S oxidoreductase
MGILNWISSLGYNTLYYPGCLAKIALKENMENYKKIFNMLGIDFIMLSPEEVCCGLPVINAGYKKEVKSLVKKNFSVFKKQGIKKIITNCPSCYHMFKDEYPKIVKEWDIEVEHATQVILNALKNKNIASYPIKEQVTYHDSCHLGRYCGIYEAPREVITLLGGEIIEMKYNRENAICCGAGAGVKANYPELAKSIAKAKMSHLPPQVDVIISACSLCASNLQSGMEKGSSKKSEEFSQFVLRKLQEGR